MAGGGICANNVLESSQHLACSEVQGFALTCRECLSQEFVAVCMSIDCYNGAVLRQQMVIKGSSGGAESREWQSSERW